MNYSINELLNQSNKNFDKKNVLGCVSSRKSDRERKINSKPCCFESERGFVFKVDTQPFLTQLQLANAVSTARKAEQAEIRLDSMHFKVHWASIRLFSTDKLRNLFFLFVQIPFNQTPSREMKPACRLDPL